MASATWLSRVINVSVLFAKPIYNGNNPATTEPFTFIIVKVKLVINKLYLLICWNLKEFFGDFTTDFNLMAWR
jgi:hypothetical protein